MNLVLPIAATVFVVAVFATSAMSMFWGYYWSVWQNRCYAVTAAIGVTSAFTAVIALIWRFLP